MSDGLKIYSSIWRPQIQLSMAVGCLIMKIPIQISGTRHKQNVNIKTGRKNATEEREREREKVAVYGCDGPRVSE